MRKIILFDEHDVTGECGQDLGAFMLLEESVVSKNRKEIQSADVVAIIDREGNAKVMKSRDGQNDITLPVECFAIRAAYGTL